MTTPGELLLVVFAYVLGAIPWGVVLGRFFARTDLREHGSRSTGATNAYRILGARISIAVLVLDVAKGIVPVATGRWLDAAPWAVAAAAVATVLGHCWSPFIRFTGGKGMATGGGAVVALSPWTLLILPVMIVIVAKSRYVSLASLTGVGMAAVAFVAAAAFDRLPVSYAAAGVAVALIVGYRHRGNVERLRAGTERKFSRSLAGAKPQASA